MNWKRGFRRIGVEKETKSTFAIRTKPAMKRRAKYDPAIVMAGLTNNDEPRTYSLYRSNIGIIEYLIGAG